MVVFGSRFSMPVKGRYIRAGKYRAKVRVLQSSAFGRNRVREMDDTPTGHQKELRAFGQQKRVRGGTYTSSGQQNRCYIVEISPVKRCKQQRRVVEKGPKCKFISSLVSWTLFYVGHHALPRYCYWSSYL